MSESPIDSRKQELRSRFRRLRADLGAQERARADAAIAANLVATPQFQQAETVFTYLSMGDEVDTREIIRQAWAAGKSVALPWCVPGTRQMRWFKVDSFDGLVKSRFGVEEPVPDAATELLPGAGGSEIALVPGFTFDAAGHRLGYGGGFYDTFLLGFGGASIGLCRRAQLSEDLHAAGVVAAHDLPVNLVVTD